MRGIAALLIVFNCSNAFATRTQLDDALEAWQDRVLELVNPKGFAGIYNDPRNRYREALRMMNLVAQFDWVLPAHLMHGGIITNENLEEVGQKLDEIRAVTLQYLNENELRYLLKHYAKNGLNRQFQGKPLPPTNLMTLLRTRLRLGTCPTILEFKPRERTED